MITKEIIVSNDEFSLAVRFFSNEADNDTVYVSISDRREENNQLIIDFESIEILRELLTEIRQTVQKKDW